MYRRPEEAGRYMSLYILSENTPPGRSRARGAYLFIDVFIYMFVDGFAEKWS